MVSKKIVVISLSLSQAEQKHDLYNSLWKTVTWKYILEKWKFYFCENKTLMSEFLK